MNKVFISYSHTNDEHKENVVKLAEKLIKAGIEIEIDEFLEYGESISHFMEQSLQKCKKIILICNKDYIIKADNRERGVGIEVDNLSHNISDKKILPICLISEDEKFELPIFLSSRKALVCNNILDKFNEILNWCYDIPKKPKLGEIPKEIKSEKISNDPNIIKDLINGELVGKLILSDKNVFKNIISKATEEEQNELLNSLKSTYSNDTGYGQFQNYTKIAEAMYEYIFENHSTENKKIALEIIEGCANYRWEVEEMLKEAKIKVLF